MLFNFLVSHPFRRIQRKGWGTESGDWVACAHLIEERGRLPLHTVSSVEVHGCRPGLPIPTAGLTCLRMNPLVETPLRLILVPWFDQFGQSQHLAPRYPHRPRRYACRHVETADKWPHTTVVIVAGPVISLVSRQPIRMMGHHTGVLRR